jgi:hypothetical protein
MSADSVGLGFLRYNRLETPEKYGLEFREFYN